MTLGSFSKHAVVSGRIDQKLFAALGRAESLRLIADYTGTPLDPKTAAETVVRAEAFVSTVEKAFALNESFIAKENDSPNPQDKISEPDLAMEQSGTDRAVEAGIAGGDSAPVSRELVAAKAAKCRGCKRSQ